MSKPFIADTQPLTVELKAGETVWWCSCGRSKNQPLCDGSHQGTDFEPIEFTAEKDGKVFCRTGIIGAQADRQRPNGPNHVQLGRHARFWYGRPLESRLGRCAEAAG